VQRHWKRCPECEALLLCPSCGGRLAQGETVCPVCQTPAGTPPAPYVEPATGMIFIPVPGGDFGMGDASGDGVENETPVHQVRLSAFHMGRFPVTQEEWRRLMAANPSRFEGPRRPVEQVTFALAQEFINRLNQKAAPGLRFDLPSEAQWEYAARSGGRNETWAGGEDPDRVAWTENNSHGASQPAGRLGPNGLGLHDMSGNVWEWCRDAFRADAYRLHGGQDPVVEAAGADRIDRVIRGGSWNLDPWSARCTRRFSFSEDCAGPALGFRLVMIRDPSQT
jgi:formylglycine-generating enzyme required for sulfatase activity